MKRESVQIKAWMVLNGISQADIGRELGISRQIVCDFIKGKKQSRRIMNSLIDKGCPKEYLAVPEEIHVPMRLRHEDGVFGKRNSSFGGCQPHVHTQKSQ